MSSEKNQVAVIGAGPMGLMCAYELLKKGYAVSLFERDDRIGGMSASFDLGGSKIERYYHFICGTDYPLFDLLREFELTHALQWVETRMGFYYEGKLYPWGDPFSLLHFPKLSFIEKIRYGLHVLYSKNIKNWQQLDKVDAITWLKKWLGLRAYNVLWDKLFELKFYEYQNELSAAWIGSRIQRVAKSRKSLFKEKLGYLTGGSELLLHAFAKKITALGGKIVLNADVKKIVTESHQVTAINVNDNFVPFAAVVSTIPLPYIAALAPDLSTLTKQKISSIKNVGVACIAFKLSQRFSPYFWMNINHSNIEIPGIIEYSNLNPDAGHILYVPYYMPQSHHKYHYHDADFLQEAIQYLKTINPQFSEHWIDTAKVSRYGFAQTVCSPYFYDKLPSMKSDIKNFYMADTAYYYPEDRCISESVRIGKELAQLVDLEHNTYA